MKIRFLKLKKTSKPTKEFKQALWTELDIAYIKTYPKSVKFLWGRFVAVPALAVVLLITTGTGVYAYSSPEVDAEDGLFVMKEGIESVEWQFYRLSGGERDYHERMLERRFEEAELRYEAGELSDRHVEMIEMRLSLLEALVENVPDLSEELSFPEELFEELKDLEVTDGLEEFEVIAELGSDDAGEDEDEDDEDAQRHRHYEEMRNIFHGARVHDDEAQKSENAQEDTAVELDLRPPQEFRMEVLR